MYDTVASYAFAHPVEPRSALLGWHSLVRGLIIKNIRQAENLN